MKTATAAPSVPSGARRVTEQRRELAVPLFGHDAWQSEHDWLVHGVTGQDADMSLFGGAVAGQVLERWTALRRALDCRTMVHARQVHGADVLVHGPLPEGILVARAADGHATASGGMLLAVSVADCVPVYIAAPDVRAVALVHAGWRGVAAGIIENGVSTLADAFGADRNALRLHCGPAICGACYEVGSEVPARLGIEGSPRHVDLRAVIAARALGAGLVAERLTLSRHCTRCGDSPFYSHRAGSSERQIAVLAIRPGA